MKAYYYTPAECGMNEFPQGTLRLDFETTTNPKEADVFVVPPNMYCFSRTRLVELPYMRGNEHKHVMLNVADGEYATYGLQSINFRCDCTKGVACGDPSTISWPWPVEDLAAYVQLPVGGFRYDVVFQGWVSTKLTDVVCDSVLQAGLKCYIKRNVKFWGYLDHTNGATDELRRTFLESLRDSRLSLVARSSPQGVVRYRFYEAMSAGRVPVHFCDNCVLPLADRIDYSKCSITIREVDAPNTGKILSAWLKNHTDEQIVEMGLYGRAMYERWLCRDRWVGIMTELVKERLGDVTL